MMWLARGVTLWKVSEATDRAVAAGFAPPDDELEQPAITTSPIEAAAKAKRGEQGLGFSRMITFRLTGITAQ